MSIKEDTFIKILENLLRKIEEKEQDKDSFLKIVVPELKKKEYSENQRQLIYICCSLIGIEEAIEKQKQQGKLVDAYLKNFTVPKMNTTLDRNQKLPEKAIKEDLYNMHLNVELGFLFGSNVEFRNTNTPDFIIKDGNKIINIEVLASSNKTGEEKHLERLAKNECDSKWSIHGITIDDVSCIIESSIPSHKEVNCIYFIHDFSFKNKRIIYQFENSNQTHSISIDSSKKKGKEEEIQEREKKAREEEIQEREKKAFESVLKCLKQIAEGKSNQEIMKSTGLTNEKIQELRNSK